MIWSAVNDTPHEIIGSYVGGVYLENGGKLHRFCDGAGTPYSAIYKDGFEELSCERNREMNMVLHWNEMQEA